MEVPERLISAIKSGKVVLFLGAGANYHGKLSNGGAIPLANSLSRLLCNRFDIPESDNLTDVAELIEATYSRKELNRYVVELLTGAVASNAFNLISTFKWNSIYTTNYDLLVESAYKKPHAIQNLKVYHTSDESIDLGENDVPLYKLHGCISKADSIEGKLIITPDDYAEFRKYRARLFNRLADQLYDKPFLYLGYGRQDPNFRTILAEVHDQMRGDIPEGFALFPGKTEHHDKVWNGKNVTLLDIDVDEFLEYLNNELSDRDYSQKLEFKFPISKQYEAITLTDIPEILTYFSLPIYQYGDKLNPFKFYKGSEANWIDLHNKVDAERDLYNEIMLELLEDSISINTNTQVTSYCLIAEAGAGKSTLLRRMAFDLSNDFEQLVFWYKGERRINLDIIQKIFKETNKRIFIFVDRASKFIGNLDTIRRDSNALSIPLTIVMADRANEWNYYSSRSYTFTNSWTMGKLSDTEIGKIINKLEDFDCLGNLKDLTEEQRLVKFKEYSDRQLLVALREATEGKDFDELILEEYESIPNTNAQRAYLHICCLHAFGKGIRTSTLARSLETPLSKLYDFLAPLEGLIDFKDDVYTARHAIVSQIVFFSLPESLRIDLLTQLIERLDLGFLSDKHIFRSLMNNDELIYNLGDINIRRRLFEALKEANPSDAYIEQHEARMEIRSVNEGGSLERAERLLKSALKGTRNALSVRHTTGTLYNKRASLSSGFEKRAYLSKAVSEFDDLTKKSFDNDYAWVSLIESRIDFSACLENREAQLSELARAEADYQRALESCGTTAFLLRAKGKLEAALGHGEDARDFFIRAISGVAPPAALFANYIRWELRHKNIEAARSASRKAIELYKSNSELQVLMAKSLILGEDWNLSDVVSLLIDAQRTSANYYKLEAHYWHGVALWESERFTDAMSQFEICRDIASKLNRADVKNIRYISGMNKGIPKEYTGSLVMNSPTAAWIICNPGAVKVYIRQKDIISGFDSMKISIGFNRLGPIAINSREISTFSFDEVV
ncbi:SIR2 family protein [Paenibacillus sp. VMFN-D1]|uniref:SIR2 family NAD-dependent protein deacylase n=1 Tax=Paenibacillus sp. VMFN-D1 TaxID=2135608 RepID=UPI000E23E139|nr:SIR2 family protein [Paenibacillus sp. VMFN-D1]RED37357.1 SIR2-like protein [Paenibacillus sp. VMFN-D1]